MSVSPTANQGARPSAAYSNAQHATQAGRGGEPQSGGDSYGKFAGVSGHDVPTSGGRARSHFATDHSKDQGGKGLYLGKAFENAQHAKGVKTKGNSVGKNELLDNHISDTVSKAAKGRLDKAADKRDSQVKGATQRFTGQPFRKSSPAFGPLGVSAARGKSEHELGRKF
jgi:hypothetical protein